MMKIEDVLVTTQDRFEDHKITRNSGFGKG